jgi:hypothetical protein
LAAEHRSVDGRCPAGRSRQGENNQRQAAYLTTPRCEPRMNAVRRSVCSSISNSS